MHGKSQPWSRQQPDSLVLSGDDVHVWRIALDQAPAHVARVAVLLSPDERARAVRLCAGRIRSRFIVGRGALRTILGAYVGMPPGQLQFRYGQWGKPDLVDDQTGEAPVRFNVAHSHGLGLYAFTRDRRIGVDVEWLRSVHDANRIARRFFSPREQAALDSLPESDRLTAFFCCWTRKEAFIKATGEGLARPLSGFDVSVGPGAPARLLGVDGRPEAIAQWSLADLAPAPGYVGALAVEGTGWHLQCYEVS